MANTSKLGVPLIASSQSQKHVTHNEALNRYDQLVQQTVINQTTSTPPSSPSDGHAYIVGSSPTGDWSGLEGQVAAWINGEWIYFVPRAGWMVYDEALSTHVVFNGTSWASVSVTFTRPTLVQVSVTHPSSGNTVSVTGTGDDGLDPSTYASSFVDVLNAYSSAYSSGALLSVDADGRVVANSDCTVHVDGYIDLTHSSNNATAGVCFGVERFSARTLSPRSVHTKMSNGGDIGHLSGNGFVDLLAGDIVGVAVSSDVTGTLTLKSSSLTFTAYA